MDHERYQKRLEKCGHHMKEAGLDVLLLTKPANMFYFTGDGRLCAYATIHPGGQGRAGRALD
jgi:Xaa-Pro aminopeptidase